MADWAEVRRLQEELERVQAASSAFKLSESNCIEIVRKLTEMKLINVLFTLDGKEYIVPEHLEREILYELEIHRGRINIVDLQQILNVDLNHVQKCVNSLLKHDKSLQFINGEIITSSYTNSLCTEINELLLQSGHVSLADLSTTFSLPLDFITTCIEKGLNGTTIRGQLDTSGSGLLYTEAYVSRHRAKIRGLFTAVTRPTPIAPLIIQGAYHTKLFLSVLHDLINTGQLSGILHGRGDKAIYIPSIYSHMQTKWIDNFMSNNGYLEYDALSRLGISEPQNYIQQRYKSRSDIVMLVTCCLGPSVVSEIGAHIDDIVKTSLKWIDIMTLLPSPCTDEDGELILQKLYNKEEQLIISGTALAHHEFIKSCTEIFKPLLHERAKQAAASSGVFLRQVSSDMGGAMGGAVEGKKGKQKKGKGRRGKETDDKDDAWQIRFISKDEITRTLLDKIEDLPETFADNLSQYLLRPLQDMFQEEARIILAAQSEGEAGAQRKRHAQLQESIQELWNRVKLFNKGIELFEGDLKLQLSKYLLRTICTDMTNQIVKYIAQDYKMTVSDDTEVFNKERPKVINKFSDPVKKVLLQLNSSLTNKEVDGFLSCFEAVCEIESCGIMLKKLDKKKEKQLLLTHQNELKLSLENEEDPAMALHLTVVLLFQICTNCLLHTPGRLLTQIITYLRQYLEPEDISKLTSFQSLVILRLKSASCEDGVDSSKEKMKEDSNKEMITRGNVELEIDSKIFEDEILVDEGTIINKDDHLVAEDGTNEVHTTDTCRATCGGSNNISSNGGIDQQLSMMIVELKNLALKPRKKPPSAN